MANDLIDQMSVEEFAECSAMARNKLHFDITAKDRPKQAMRSVRSRLKATNKAANLLKDGHR